MKQYEPYKRLIRIGSALSVIGLETAIYWYVWNGYYNRILEYPSGEGETGWRWRCMDVFSPFFFIRMEDLKLDI